ncbi:DksA/TraR family C4-type zinc finger protein [Falsirhodobacter xinxiangensis]|uniref:DksA/TraR family C4-type zinc finger protein n=1 Tax=Falsirhodobacter xinxiangensis TaxID=2530049 RepID=UPI0010A9FC0D|nr:DksA/TraR family C4-type zinc finger protein [Rhodobacter xinxiangensis]
MAGGWARDGAVNEQIDASIADELSRLKALRRPTGESFAFCAECEEPIPEARRIAIPGVKLCIDCQRGRDARPEDPRGGINRRGSKDSQLR